MNVFLEGEQLLQVQLEIPRKCQLRWSFDMPWGECSHLCNPVVLFGQIVSITWHLTESRVRLHLCSWLHAFLCLRSGNPCSEQYMLYSMEEQAVLWHSCIQLDWQHLAAAWSGLLCQLWTQGSVFSLQGVLPVFSATPKSFLFWSWFGDEEPLNWVFL